MKIFVKKTFIKSSLCFVLSFCLSLSILSFLSGTAFASVGDTITFNNETFDSSSWRTLYAYVHDFLIEHSDEGWDYMVLGQVTNQYGNRYNSFSITISQFPIRNMGGQMEVYLSEQGNPSGVHGFWIDGNGSVSNVTYNSVGSTTYGYRYYPTNYPNIGSYSYGWFWSSHENDICPANLIVPEFLPPVDNRVFTVHKVLKDGNYWIYFEAYPLSDITDFVSITFDWSDTLGSFHEVALSSDFYNLEVLGFVDVHSDGIVGYYNPKDISEYFYNISGATIYTLDEDYGSKSISLDLDFNSQPYPLNPNYNDYTSYSYYQYFNSLDSMVAGWSDFRVGLLNGAPAGSQNYYWSSDGFIRAQPYELKTICLPDLLNNISETKLVQLYETYDLIVTDCNEQVIDAFYYSGFYAYLSQQTQTVLLDMCMEATPNALQLPSDAVTGAYHLDSSCGLFLTRNALLKQISYFCGDTSLRLLEFETRLVDTDDGVLTSIQNKLSEAYLQNNVFFNDILPAVQNISYILNGMDFGVLNTISCQLDSLIVALGNLPSTDLSSVESSLLTIESSLVTLNDSILGLDLTLEDVNLIFPEFNFDIIIENNPTSNIEYFVDFVNDFFVAIPDVDFSPLHTIGTDFTSIFDSLDVDSSYSNFLDSLLDPYSFSDSHLSDYD